MGKIDGPEEVVEFSPDPDQWLGHNCKYCKNKVTCDLYKGLIDSQKELEFTSTSLDCPWLRYH
jgi:hypothetical protein